MFSQEDGTKRRVLAALLAKGYQPDHVLMMGDAPGDAEAASRNRICFYPVRVRWEGQDWREFAEEALPRFFSCSYSQYGRDKYRQFMENLQA